MEMMTLLAPRIVTSPNKNVSEPKQTLNPMVVLAEMPMSQVVCLNCGRVGHYRRNCTSPPKHKSLHLKAGEKPQRTPVKEQRGQRGSPDLRRGSPLLLLSDRTTHSPRPQVSGLRKLGCTRPPGPNRDTKPEAHQERGTNTDNRTGQPHCSSQISCIASGTFFCCANPRGRHLCKCLSGHRGTSDPAISLMTYGRHLKHLPLQKF